MTILKPRALPWAESVLPLRGAVNFDIYSEGVATTGFYEKAPCDFVRFSGNGKTTWAWLSRHGENNITTSAWTSGHEKSRPRGFGTQRGRTCEKGGGDLLSRIALQYHRRGRA